MTDIAIRSLVRGRFTMTVSGGRRGTMVLAEFDNLITNSGLNDIFTGTGGGSGASRCQLGTGIAVPAVTDSALHIPGPASTTTQVSFINSSYTPGPPDYASSFITIRFSAGVATGTWTEVGMTRNLTPFTLFSRALIVDGGGSPVPITVLSDETLDVTYTVRIYPPASDIAGSINLGPSTHDYVIRPAATDGGWLPWAVVGSAQFAGYSGNSGPAMIAYTGALGSRTAYPSGTNTSFTPTVTAAAYSNNSYQRSSEYSIALNQGNLAGGVRTLLVPLATLNGTPAANYQVEFTPNIAKDATKVLRLNFTASVARRP